MKSIIVNKADLIEKVKTNRDEHREQFLRAQEKYREAVIEDLDKRLQSARDGKPIATGWHLQEPVDYTSSYDTALEMLAWEVDDKVSLDQKAFEELVLNKWGWQDLFQARTASYLG